MKGTYCLVVDVAKDSIIRIGALGNKYFKRGCYAYIGSALNSLEKRVERYLRRSNKKHWHIDYLLADKHVKALSIFIKEGNKKEECMLAAKVGKIGQAFPKFGCSDCKCEAHLFKVDRRKLEELLKKEGFKRWR